MKPKQNEPSRFFSGAIDTQQCKDSCMAVVLICLLVGFFTENILLFSVSIAFLFVGMAAPRIYAPFARLWFGLSKFLGTIMSKIILTILFFAVVTPMGLIRKMFGADPLQLKKWKKGTESVFSVRDHTFEPKEIEKPY